MSHYAIEPGRAIDLVREAGGVPIIAHPWGRSSYKVMTADTIARLVDDHGLAGIEVDHQDHSRHSRTALREIADDLGIIHRLERPPRRRQDRPRPGVNSTEPEQFERLLEVAKVNAAPPRRGGARGLPAVNSVINLSLLSEVFVTLFVIMDPPGTVPVFISLTAGQSRAVRKKAAWQAVLVAFGVIVVFAVFGQQILHNLGITLPRCRPRAVCCSC